MALFNLVMAALLTALGLFETDPPPADPPTGKGKGGKVDPPAGDGDGDAGDGDDEGDDGDEGGEGSGDGTDLKGLTPEELQKRLTKARRDAKSAKGQGKRAQDERDAAQRQLSAIAAALGLKPEDNDPEVLQSKLTGVQAELRNEKVSNAVYRQAIAQGAKPELLMRWLRGGDELKDLDPSSSTFAADVRELVKVTLEENEELQAKQGAGRQGGDFTGQPNKSLEDRIAEAQEKGDHREVIRLQASKLASSS